MSHRIWRGFAATILAALLPISAHAIPSLTVGGWRLGVQNNSANSVGVLSGEQFVFGAGSVVSSIGGPITGHATTSPHGANFPIPFVGVPENPNGYLGRAPYGANASLTGDTWTITFNDGNSTVSSDSTTFPVGQFPAGVKPIGFVRSMTVQKVGNDLVFSWGNPSGLLPGGNTHGFDPNYFNAFNIAIFEKGALGSGLTKEIRLSPFTNTRTVTSNDFVFDPTKQYAIGLAVFQTRTGATFGGENIYGAAQVFFDFNPGAVGANPVFLPVTQANGAYQFDIATVIKDTLIYIDPKVAVGYDYAIGLGDPNFASVLLPTGIGDNLFDLFGFDALNNPVLLAADWLGGVAFNFGPGGVDRFRVLGIETSAGLDPADTQAFVTGLTFTADGQFTGTQTPLTARVPEPGALLIFSVGLVTFVVLRRRRDRVILRSAKQERVQILA